MKLVHGKVKKIQPLTRTIWVSCLSRFLLWFLHSRQNSKTPKPGLAQLPSIKILYRDNHTASRQICTANAAPVPLIILIYLEKYPTSYKTCTATAPCLNKTYAMTAKTRAIPSLHREKFVANTGTLPGACVG
jgi:hypothetical protein